MRYEEHHNTPVLVVEPDDERVVVLNWLGLYATRWQQQRGSIVVVVPQDAVFRRPGDLRELQQVTASQNALGINSDSEKKRLFCPFRRGWIYGNQAP